MSIKKVRYEVRKPTPMMGSRDKKVYIYHDDVLYTWFWMSTSEIAETVKWRQGLGREVEVVWEK